MPKPLVVTDDTRLVAYDLRTNRVFIGVAESGCGTNCAYCYIPNPGGPQILYPSQSIVWAVEKLVSIIQLGREGTLISLCPDTEPFKSQASTSRVLSVLGRVMPLGNPIQISTKERVSDRVMGQIAALQEYPGQVVLFTSCVTVSGYKLVEPGAPAPSVRFSNFTTARSSGITKLPVHETATCWRC